MDNGHFKVTDGTGYLYIALEDWNHNSPEGAYESVKIPVVSEAA